MERESPKHSTFSGSRISAIKPKSGMFVAGRMAIAKLIRATPFELGAHDCVARSFIPIPRANHASLSHNSLWRKNPRQEPYTLILHVRICAGGGAVGDCPSYRDRCTVFSNAADLAKSGAFEIMARTIQNEPKTGRV